MLPPDLRRLLRLARPETNTLIAGTVALALSSGLMLAYPKVVGALIDGARAGTDRGDVDRSAMLLLTLFFVGGVAGGLRSYWFTVAGERVVTRLREDLYRALIRQEVAFFDQRRTGELTNRLAADTAVLQNAATVNLSMLLRFGAMGLGSIVILAWMSWKLTLVMLAVVPPVAVASMAVGRRLRSVSTEVQDALAESSEIAEETLSGIRTVRSFAREPQEARRYAGAVQRSFDLARRRALIGAWFGGGITFVGYGAIGLVLWYGGALLVRGEMTVGELTSFVIYTFTVAMSVGSLAGLWQDFMKALGASARVFELMDREPAFAAGGSRPATVRGEVTLERVAFRYPARRDAPVLRGIDLHIAPGELVALVGPSGAGKSTIAALLSRFYDPDEGTLKLDGVPYDELDADWLREQVGVVSQEPILFATSIRDNIRYGRPDADEAAVVAAAQAAYADGFVRAFPDGYDTLVGERGVRLSGGQKQRVAIARALLKDPRVLILDEATSALDAESEHLVQQALATLMRGRTTIVIAHRLSTVQRADRVLVLDGGAVVQSGTHAELLADDGLYRQLVQRQLSA